MGGKCESTAFMNHLFWAMHIAMLNFVIEKNIYLLIRMMLCNHESVVASTLFKKNYSWEE